MLTYRFIFVVAFSLINIVAFAQKQPILAFTSDTQQPMTVEKIFLKSNRNEEATKMIFKDVNALRPAAFFILGDVVSVGFRNRKWKAIDRYIADLKKDSIPVYATLGNHEVMFIASKGIKQFRSRFPEFKPEGYTEVIDSVAVVLLNSNFDKMKAAEIKTQDDWYLETMKKLDANPAIRAIIVGCHHSPYTNSTIVKPSIVVQQKFVPAFIASKKAQLFLTGHSHNFERFKVQGKDFLVIGGGGGLHQPLLTAFVTPDLEPKYKPAFHYLQVSREGDKLNILSRQLKTDFSGFDDGINFKIQ
ncbi:MAG: metallophosphoesterase [Sphingobacteriaceae bacterium]|nr:MAG: metallophosphoesterase [Sphingobacteriaceae bacterium]